MEMSTFVSGYFVGLVAGGSVFVWWTYKFGRFLPEEWPLTRAKIAAWIAGEKEVSFYSRRVQSHMPPAE